MAFFLQNTKARKQGTVRQGVRPAHQNARQYRGRGVSLKDDDPAGYWLTVMILAVIAGTVLLGLGAIVAGVVA